MTQTNNTPANEYWKIVVSVVATVVYALAFLILVPDMGSSMGALSIVPVSIIASFYGLRAGIIAGFLVFPLNTLLLNIGGEAGWNVIMRVGGMPGTMAVVIIGGIMGYLRDTRSRYQQVIRQLATVTNQIEGLVAAIPEDIFHLDDTGDIIAYHPGQETNLEIRTPHIVGQCYRNVLPRGIVGVLQVPFTQVIASKRPTKTEFERRIGDATRSFEANFYPLPNQNILLIVRDVTASRELIQQRIMMEVQGTRIEFLRDFIGSISHDFQTPLAIIKANLYLIERLKHDPNKQQAKFEQVKQQTSRLEKLVNDVLIISRLDNDLEASQNRIDLNRIVSSAIGNLQHRAKAKNIDIQLNLSHGQLPVLGNELSLHQAVMCLVENAITYTPEDGEIIIRGHIDGDNVSIAVIDNGIGIDADDLPQIFDYFFRADKARSLETGGAGLGLSIVQRIVDLHHGELDVQSQVGIGSTFTMRLPHFRKKEEILTEALLATI